VARKRAGGTPATVALERAGIGFVLREYLHDREAHARGVSYGLEAASALGLDPVRVFKTLVVAVDGHLAVAIVPVTGDLSLKAMARALGGSRAAMADVQDAERATGYVAGGISPIGQRRRLPTVLDLSAMQQPTVFVSAGRRGLDLEIAPADLVEVTGATTAAIAGSSR
jgi:Cys-tRNA(Pro)/Cys-tRNA(Cys) deacylase